MRAIYDSILRLLISNTIGVQKIINFWVELKLTLLHNTLHQNCKKLWQINQIETYTPFRKSSISEGQSLHVSPSSHSYNKTMTITSNVIALECFSTYLKKNYTSLRLEDIFPLKKIIFNSFCLIKYEKLDNKRHYYRFLKKTIIE